MVRHPEQISIKYRPLQLEYGEFARCNDQCFVDEPISQDEFAGHRGQGFWAVYAGRSLIGYGIAVDSGRTRRVKRIAICPEYRGRTFGQQLLATMVAHGVDEGCEEFVLSVQQNNPAAVHIYEKFGFSVVGESFQYIVDVAGLAKSAQHPEPANACTIVPITECAPESLPEGMERWREAYRYPDSQVLMFSRREVGFVGFCRLNPAFPGCSPFEVWHAGVHVNDLLVLLDDRLVPGKKRLKVTFADAGLAGALEEAGYTRNYSLFEMSLDRRTA